MADGAPSSTYRNWSGPPESPQRPDDSSSDEYCAGMASSALDNEEDGSWNDLVCGSTAFVACDFPLPTPAP